MKISPTTRLMLLLGAGVVTAVFAFTPADKKAETVGAIATPVLARSSSDAPATRDASPLPLEKLRRTPFAATTSDLFPVESWAHPTSAPQNDAPPPAPPPPPSAPPLPFTYQGRFQDDSGNAVIYLSEGDNAYSLREGDTMNDLYRVDAIDSAQIAITYLPLNIKQILAIEAQP